MSWVTLGQGQYKASSLVFEQVLIAPLSNVKDEAIHFWSSRILSERVGASAEVQQDQINYGPDGVGSVALLAELFPGEKRFGASVGEHFGRLQRKPLGSALWPRAAWRWLCSSKS